MQITQLYFRSGSLPVDGLVGVTTMQLHLMTPKAISPTSAGVDQHPNALSRSQLALSSHLPARSVL